jgi:hypothetical protein
MSEPSLHAPLFDIQIDVPKPLSIVPVLALEETVDQIAGFIIAILLQNEIRCVVAAPLAQSLIVLERRVKILPDMHDLMSRRCDEVHLGQIY